MSIEHFKGKYEVELKYRLPSEAAFLAQLRQLPHQVMLENNTEFDCYFDTSERRLQRQHKSVCIREMEPSGIKLWIVKGPEPDRCEATRITNAESARSMLVTMGYQPVLRIDKTRSIYFMDDYHITLDHLQGIGFFAEFAIMTDDEAKLPVYRQELEALSARFGLDASHLENKSYREMVANLQNSNHSS
ncbi:class IV adenylate cyclase [Celerinatantimonas sp. YJH-8]|uniref:class IV adenylate cyclase n=1 Tax=Celerinatantimonas sp. YJH-8 TaxID=3228714 RepID=UPI0038C5879F